MRKADKNLKKTTDNREYNAALSEKTSGCPICSPNRGCNRNRDNFNDNWKHYRKNQWRD